MDWLFERMIELAAWVAFIMGIVFLCDAIWMFALWVRNFGGEESIGYLTKAGQASASFVGSAVALGVLACIDRYVFDLAEEE